MVDSAAPGWYPDSERPGGFRYRDGNRWTDQRSAPRPAPVPVPRQGDEPRGVPLYRRGWLLGAAGGLVLGLLVGVAGSGQTDVTKDPAYVKLAKSRAGDKSQAAAQLAQTKSDLAKARAALGTLPAREAALKTAQRKLKAGQGQLHSDQAALKQSSASVAARERKVGLVEKDIANNTLSGDGLYEVGTDMKAGTYKTSGTAGCYYAILNSTNTSDIADNNNTDGPALVTLNSGKYFETAGCADWVVQH